MTQIALLLQVAILMLTGVANNQNATQTQRDQAFAFANQAVTMAMQYIQNPDVTPTSTPTVPQITLQAPTETVTPIAPVEPAPVFGATPAPVIEVKKTLKVYPCSYLYNSIGIYCNIGAEYYEDGVLKRNVPITFSADDEGTFVGWTPENNGQSFTTTSPAVSWAGNNGRASATYRPMSQGLRNIVVSRNGVSQTIQVQGQIAKCAGVTPNWDLEKQCNQ